MSYTEYFDMYHKAQEKDCPYRAFIFDVKNSRLEKSYSQNFEKHHECLDYIYTLLELEEQHTGKKILLKDKYNKNSLDRESVKNGNLRNPMPIGDSHTYFVYNHSITIERMVELFVEALCKYNISYSFHFATGVYETNDYGEGGQKLFKGYMPRILEDISKVNGLLISRDHTFLDEKEM